ncbi:hypothetical protein HGO38_07815 [Rhizobium sp. CG5]|nr:hypothetical protein [Rhizobium sp. CG5]
MRSGIWVLLYLAMLAGCTAGVPLEDLKNFREAFLEAQKAGDLVYDEIAPILSKESGHAEACTTDRSGTPKCFDPDQVIGNATRSNEDPSLRARRLALALLSEYSLALVELSDGRSQQELTRSIQETAELATALTALAGAAAPAGLPALLTQPIIASFTDLAVRLDRVRTAETVRAALIANQDTIARLIDQLIADTRPIYAIYYRNQTIRVLESPAAATASEMAKAAKYHEALTAYVVILRQMKASNARLARLASAAPGSAGELRAVVEEATRIKLSAETFWSAIREVRK